MSLAPQIKSLTQDQQNQVYIEFINTIQRVKYSTNSIPFQTSYSPQIVNTHHNSIPLEHSHLAQNINYPNQSYHPYHNIPLASSSLAHSQPSPVTQSNSIALNPPCYSQNNSSFDPSPTSTSTFSNNSLYKEL